MTEKEVILNKLNHTLSNRARDIQGALAHIEKTGQMIDDYLVPSKKLQFASNGKVKLEFQDESIGLHSNAVNQLAARFGVNAKDLQREATGKKWERDVFAHRMNEYGSNAPRKNVLVRKVNDQAKAILSDRYRIINTAAIFAAFLKAAAEAGAVLVDATHGDLRDFLEVIHPEVIEIPTEKNGIIYFGMGSQIRDSGFGVGKFDVRIFGINCVCINGMTRESMMSQVHLGSRLETSQQISFAQETIEADTVARSLAVRDIMKNLFSRENFERERKMVYNATEIELDFPEEIKKLPKMGMLKGEVDVLTKTLMESNPDDGIQGKNTLWKLTQGVTAVANKLEDAERKRDLQDLASTLTANFVK